MAKEFDNIPEVLLYNFQLKEWADMIGQPVPDDMRATLRG